MEKTLGKRIAENRKRLGLTQEALAEQLGITAQAVSKWENDQSCPDISILPKLAEIFGITVDALLGVQTQQPVPEAWTCEKEEEWEENGFRARNGKWEFHWDSGRSASLAFAVLVLLTGVLTLLSKLLHWEVSFWSILWPSVLLVYGLKGLICRFNFFCLGCSAFGGYFLVENLGFWKLNVAGEMVFPIIIVLFGLSLFADALRKPAKPRFWVLHKGNKASSKGSCTTGKESFNCKLSFGENTHTVILPRLSGGNAKVDFGELTVDLQGCESVSENCLIDAKCSFGQLNLLVPKCYRVEAESRTAVGSVEWKGHPDPEPKSIIKLDVNVNFGAVEIQYI